jgi:hypothetical protein
MSCLGLDTEYDTSTAVMVELFTCGRKVHIKCCNILKFIL